MLVNHFLDVVPRGAVVRSRIVAFLLKSAHSLDLSEMVEGGWCGKTDRENARLVAMFLMNFRMTHGEEELKRRLRGWAPELAGEIEGLFRDPTT